MSWCLEIPNMPAILTENGFVDSASDSAKLKDPAFLQSIAVAHCKGICDYFGIQYKEGVVSKVADVVQPVKDKDGYLMVRVLDSKSVAVQAQIIAMGYACKPVVLP